MLRVISFLSIILLAACDNEFELEAPYQDLPIVYGYLDVDEQQQFIRVQRLLQTGGADAGAVANDEQALYYAEDAATVTLTNPATRESATLERVNGADFDLPRAAGVFLQDPNVLYRLPEGEVTLQPGQTVELRISRSGEIDAVASTEILRPLQIVRPTTQVRIDDYRRPLLISWEAGANAAVFSVEITFTIREFDLDNPANDRTVALSYLLAEDYVPENNQRNGNNVLYEANNESIYRFLGDNLTADDNIARRLDGIDLRITAVGPELAALLSLSDANTGLTGAQAPPAYTNVNGGRGVFTSRTSTAVTDIQFDEGSVDSLREGRYTRRLNFR